MLNANEILSVKMEEKKYKLAEEESDRNVKAFDELKKNMGDIDQVEDLSKLGNAIDHARFIDLRCYKYDDDYYPGLDVYIINSKLKKEVQSYINKLNKRIQYLITTYKWIMVEPDYWGGL